MANIEQDLREGLDPDGRAAAVSARANYQGEQLTRERYLEDLTEQNNVLLRKILKALQTAYEIDDEQLEPEEVTEE